MPFYVNVGTRGILFHLEMIWSDLLGSLPYRWTNRLRPGTEAKTKDHATRDEFGRIRRACVDLGADQELTELVLASHRHDRTLLDVMVANGDDLRDYVQYKLAIWEAIFNENEERPVRSYNGAAGAIRADKLVGSGRAGACARAAAEVEIKMGTVVHDD